MQISDNHCLLAASMSTVKMYDTRVQREVGVFSSVFCKYFSILFQFSKSYCLVDFRTESERCSSSGHYETSSSSPSTSMTTPLENTLAMNESSINDMRVSANGRYMVTAAGKDVRLWDMDK